MKIRISKDLSLPLEILTQAVGILAKRRAGKSYTARRLAEQLLAAGQQVVIVDPKGDTWGIRSSADGKHPGYPVVIIGGERGDVKLESGAGEIVAKLVVEERISVLVDLSLLRKHEVSTFMTAFLETLYRLKAQERFRTPMMLIIDEADAIAPQKPQKGQERMLGAAEDIVRRGGQRGIGCTLVTQRAAVLNKNVLTQIQVLVVLRTIAPQDLAALAAWVEVHGTEEQLTELEHSLPSLPIGDAWFWSPGWPDAEGIFNRVHILPIDTFDSGATPKAGEKRIEPRSLADINLGALSRQMAETIERSKADDPRLLRQKIIDLEKQLAKRVEPAVKGDSEARKKSLEAAHARGFEAGKRAYRKEIAPKIQEFVGKSTHAFNEALGTLGYASAALKKELQETAAKLEIVSEPIAPARITAPRATPSDSNGALSKGGRVILTAIAQHREGVTREQVAVLTGYRATSRYEYLRQLQASGLIDQTGQIILATDAGREVLGSDYEPLPKGDALREYWLPRLSEGERKILQVAIARYDTAVERQEFLEATGYKATSVYEFTRQLLARKLLVKSGRGVQASSELFD